MKSTTISIPTTIGGAVKALNSLDGLITASEWERSAIVYAFTFKGTNQNDPLAGKSASESINAFAKRGILGLKSTESVSFYRSQWETARAKHGASEAKPGAQVRLPDPKLWVGQWLAPDESGKSRKDKFIAPAPTTAKAVSKDGFKVAAFVDGLSPKAKAEIQARIHVTDPITKGGLTDDQRIAAVKETFKARPDLAAAAMMDDAAAAGAAEARRVAFAAKVDLKDPSRAGTPKPQPRSPSPIGSTLSMIDLVSEFKDYSGRLKESFKRWEKHGKGAPLAQVEIDALTEAIADLRLEINIIEAAVLEQISDDDLNLLLNEG